MTVGSLCTGIAGLEHGLTLAGLDTETVFVSDIDKGACTWLEANIAAPNLGDFTALEELPPVDILTAGFPCQPLSLAGLRKGVNDERWLFDDICRLVGRMGTQPLVFLENVPGLLTANDGHAMARVVHGLAAIGYNLDYGVVAASDIGACHRRLRWWGLACPADTDPDDLRQYRSFPEPVRTEAALERAQDPDRLARFGRYAPAIRRWETVLGRPIPHELTVGPTLLLDDRFCEWLMGYPEGYVTSSSLSRNRAIRALGNAVVPQCAAAAFTALAARVDDQAADGKSQTPAARSLTRW